MRLPLIVALSCAMTCSVYAQTQDSGTGTKPKTQKSSAKSVFPNEIQELKDAVAAQQEQIKQLQQQIQTRDSAIEQLQNQVKNIPVPAAPPAPTDYSGDINTLNGDVKDLKATDASLAEGLTETQKRVGDLESPAAIHYKGVLITPGGFLAGETVWRQRAQQADINTQLNGIPFSAAGQARQSEFYGSGRQSRLALLVQGKAGNLAMTGYYETDFLSAGITSNNNQSNSYTLRQRQVWGQAALNNGWTFTAGQMWSLVTETRKGEDNRTEATPLTIDPQYTVGFSWARQYGFRITKNLHNKVWFGFSVENSQELLTASNANSNFLLGGPGNCGGLYNCGASVGGYTSLVSGITTTTTKIGNTTVVTGVTPTNATIVNPGAATNYSSNLAPDFIGKLAFEPGFGHYEVFFVGSLFRDRIYPNFATKSAVGAFNNDSYGFGIGANARWLFAKKKVETGLHFLGGNGVARYGDSTLPDLTVDGLGYLHPLRSYQGLAEVVYHLPKWDFYFDGGGEYVSNWARPYNGTLVGYGVYTANNTGCGTETLPTNNNGYAPGGLGSCTGQTRVLIEGTTGFWYKPYNGPKGRLQMGLQYSYITRNTWAGTNNYKSAPYSPQAIDNMVFTSFRYYLP